MTPEVGLPGASPGPGETDFGDADTPILSKSFRVKVRFQSGRVQRVTPIPVLPRHDRRMGRWGERGRGGRDSPGSFGSLRAIGHR